jgi:hypothetical protein
MLNEKDMIDFIAQRCSRETEAEIRKEFKDPNSFARRFIEEWSRRTREAFDVDWLRLILDENAEGGKQTQAE